MPPKQRAYGALRSLSRTGRPLFYVFITTTTTRNVMLAHGALRNEFTFVSLATVKHAACHTRETCSATTMHVLDPSTSSRT